MGLFDKVTGALGLSGGQSAGGGAQADLRQIAAGIRNFRPIRIRSGIGTGTLDQRGMSFAPTEQFAGAQRNIVDFFGGASRALSEFDPRTASDEALGLFRERRATQADTQLSRLESRLLSQGRLGVGTGARGANPELEGFFSAEAMADLEAQIASQAEARAQGQFLTQQAAGGLELVERSQLPFGQGLFQLAQLDLARSLGAGNIEAGGAEAAMKGKVADQNARASFFSGIIEGISNVAAAKAGKGG